MENTICWVDIEATNLDRAQKFYSAILGKELQKIEENGCAFILLPHEGDNVSGCLIQGQPSAKGPLVYLNVIGRIEEAINKVVPNEGKILEPITKIGEYGTRAIILDSEGNKIALYDK